MSKLYFKYGFDMEKLIHRFNIRKGDKYQVLARKGDRIAKVFINLRCEINFVKDLVFFNS